MIEAFAPGIWDELNGLSDSLQIEDDRHHHSIWRLLS